MVEFTCAAYSLASRPQGSILDDEEQPFLVAASNPSFHSTREKSHIPCLECNSSHCGTLQADFNEAGPQHHTENMVILDLHGRLSGRSKHIYSYSHPLSHSS